MALHGCDEIGPLGYRLPAEAACKDRSVASAGYHGASMARNVPTGDSGERIEALRKRLDEATAEGGEGAVDLVEGSDAGDLALALLFEDAPDLVLANVDEVDSLGVVLAVHLQDEEKRGIRGLGEAEPGGEGDLRDSAGGLVGGFDLDPGAERERVAVAEGGLAVAGGIGRRLEEAVPSGAVVERAVEDVAHAVDPRGEDALAELTEGLAGPVDLGGHGTDGAAPPLADRRQ